ncbi:MAG: hypothetical protein KAS93_03730 [Gammaproteobacteria bacterium]|nr:hypothetical protein [Gammaproteobacteria bacterium]
MLKIFVVFGKQVAAFYKLSYARKLTALRYYRANTVSRFIVKLVMYCLVIFRLDGLLFCGQAKYDKICGKLNELFPDGYGFFVIFPSEKDRARVYIHVIDECGKRILFCKVALDDLNRRLIRNEKDALLLLAERESLPFLLPRVEFCKESEGMLFLCTQSMPSGSRLYSQCREMPVLFVPFITRNMVNVSFAKLAELEWYKVYSNTAKSNVYASFRIALQSLLELLPEHRFSLACAHGDFGSENIFLVRDDFYIIDWERFNEQAPIKTDEVGWWLGKHHQLIKRLPDQGVKLFKSTFLDTDDLTCKVGYMLALVYMCSVGFNVAVLLVVNWE